MFIFRSGYKLRTVPKFLYLPLESLVYSSSTFSRLANTRVLNQVFPKNWLGWTGIYIEHWPQEQRLATIQLKI